jgi:hypothetical protein
MYNAKIITDAGKEFRFGYEYGTIFDISPLSGNDVTLGTSQGFQQIGVTVENQSIGGVYRTIRGTILNKQTAKKMLSFLPAFTSGRLFVNDSRFCNIVINRTPELNYLKTGKITFSMRVFCASPYWSDSASNSFTISSFKKAFSFPVIYDSHRFAIQSETAFINCYNVGDVASPLICEFTSDTDVTNYGVINVRTLQELRFDDTLRSGEKTKVFYENGRIKATKEDEDGNVMGFLGYLSDSSNLFDILPGDNIIKATADTNEKYLRALVSFRPAFMGVVP